MWRGRFETGEAHSLRLGTGGEKRQKFLLTSPGEGWFKVVKSGLEWINSPPDHGNLACTAFSLEPALRR